MLWYLRGFNHVVFLMYFVLDFVVSGIIVYRTIGDKSRLPVLARLLLSFLIIFYGGMILNEPYQALIGEPFRELIGIGRVWVDESAIEDNSIELSIKAALVISGGYVGLFLVFSFVPACVILVSTLVGKSRK